MVLLHVVQEGGHNKQFLYHAQCGAEVGALVDDLATVWNLRLRLGCLCDAAEATAAGGDGKEAAAVGALLHRVAIARGVVGGTDHVTTAADLTLQIDAIKDAVGKAALKKDGWESALGKAVAAQSVLPSATGAVDMWMGAKRFDRDGILKDRIGAQENTRVLVRLRAAGDEDEDEEHDASLSPGSQQALRGPAASGILRKVSARNGRAIPAGADSKAKRQRRAGKADTTWQVAARQLGIANASAPVRRLLEDARVQKAVEVLSSSMAPAKSSTTPASAACSAGATSAKAKAGGTAKAAGEAADAAAPIAADAELLDKAAGGCPEVAAMLERILMDACCSRDV